MRKHINQTKKAHKLLMLIVFVMGVNSCTTSKSFVSNSANLEKYNYATITNVMDYRGSATMLNIEVEIYDALTLTRLKVIGDNEINSLSEMQKEEPDTNHFYIGKTIGNSLSTAYQ